VLRLDAVLTTQVSPVLSNSSCCAGAEDSNCSYLAAGASLVGGGDFNDGGRSHLDFSAKEDLEPGFVLDVEEILG
jgi:hypothetical protein